VAVDVAVATATFVDTAGGPDAGARPTTPVNPSSTTRLATNTIVPSATCRPTDVELDPGSRGGGALGVTGGVSGSGVGRSISRQRTGVDDLLRRSSPRGRS
jgi:hypothetical protein